MEITGDATLDRRPLPNRLEQIPVARVRHELHGSTLHYRQ